MNKTYLILALILLFFFGCKRDEKVVVDFWHVMGGPLGRRLTEMIGDFNRLHPEGEVRGVHMGSYDVLAQKLMGAISSGNSPPRIHRMKRSCGSSSLLVPSRKPRSGSPDVSI